MVARPLEATAVSDLTIPLSSQAELPGETILLPQFPGLDLGKTELTTFQKVALGLRPLVPQSSHPQTPKTPSLPPSNPSPSTPISTTPPPVASPPTSTPPHTKPPLYLATFTITPPPTRPSLITAPLPASAPTADVSTSRSRDPGRVGGGTEHDVRPRWMLEQSGWGNERLSPDLRGRGVADQQREDGGGEGSGGVHQSGAVCEPAGSERCCQGKECGMFVGWVRGCWRVSFSIPVRSFIPLYLYRVLVRDSRVGKG